MILGFIHNPTELNPEKAKLSLRRGHKVVGAERVEAWPSYQRMNPWYGRLFVQWLKKV